MELIVPWGNTTPGPPTHPTLLLGVLLNMESVLDAVGTITRYDKTTNQGHHLSISTCSIISIHQVKS